VNALAKKLAARIDRDGPLSIEDFMAVCLLDPEHGYYTTRDPFGAPGDFITAPEVSQMFGELIGLWLWSVWQGAGSPENTHLVELGPGRGTLMADALRAIEGATRQNAPFCLHLVEASPTLRQQQRVTLGQRAVTWHDDLDTLPIDGSVLFVANEFFDALPLRQYVATPQGWRERLVTCRDGAFEAILSSEPSMIELPQAPTGRVGEAALVRLSVMATMAQRIAGQGGAALIIDFTDNALPVVDTFQAVRAHQFADRFADPGEADLASAVDFSALSKAAVEIGVATHGPVSQGNLLAALGIEERCRALKQNASSAQAAALDAAYNRLVSPEGMGEDFVALALLPVDQAAPAGFEVLPT
jgi:NADH dehydrogenase [ubiquinone] 1 alpha subcomplex assembly factor 7